MTDIIFLSLLFLHVFFAIAWLGSLLYSNMLLVPLMRSFSAPTRSEVSGLTFPRTFRYNLIMGSAALVFGVILYGYINFATKANATSPSGIPFIQAGALIALAGLLANSFVIWNALKKMEKLTAREGNVLAAPTTPSNEMLGLQNRIRVSGLVGMVVLIVVVALMVVGANI